MKKNFIAIAASIVAGASIAGAYIVSTEDTGWKLMRGTRNVETGFATFQECENRALVEIASRKSFEAHYCDQRIKINGGWEPDAPPPPPPPAPEPAPSAWEFAATEFGVFTVAQPTIVRYGSGTQWVQRSVTGSVECTNTFFGGDPAPMMTKSCEVLADVGPTPPPEPSPAPSPAPAPAPTPAPAPAPVPPVDMGMMPMVNADLIPTGSAGSATDRVNFTPERPAASDGTGAFRTVCDFSHMNFDDAIVYPGQVGRSHLHAYFGNTGVNANSTAASISSTGNSTCRGGTLNRSAYWVPAMIDTRNGAPVKPSASHFYYKTGYGGVAPSAVQAMPPGLRIVAGDMKNAVPGGKYESMPWSYTCQADGSGDRSIPNCAVGAEIWQTIHFPQCWDGVNLDSPDHKSHMAYPTGQGCPSSHPVPVPEITFNIVYTVTEANSPLHWRLSSDNYSADLPGGYSAHGDWFNGWRPEIMDTFVNNCDKPALDCHSHLLGDGREIY